jgi:hypothetical protein
MMKRRDLFGAMLLPLFGRFRKKTSKPEWNSVKHPPPVNEWVWIDYAGGCVELGRLGEDGVWELVPTYLNYERRTFVFVVHTVVRWMKIERPELS